MKSLPFDKAHYEQHLPEIERRIRELKPHVIVMGLGPSAWLLRDIPKDAIEGVRLWGVNDVFKIMPVHDITIMDIPIRELHPSTPRYKQVVESTPQRWWFFAKCAPHWRKILPNVESREFQLKLWHPHQRENHKKPQLQSNPHHHTIASPVGTVSIAWAEGCRRIGLIGVDLIDGQHRLSHHHDWLDFFLGKFGKQANALGGQIANLSPFSRIQSLQPKPVTA